MSNRAAKFASAVLASLLASIPLTATPLSAAGTAGAEEECLSAPKGETPQGSHWYYRFERGSKRQCWYLRGEGEKAANTAPLKLSPPAKPVAGKTDTTMQSSISNAHAELTPQTRSLQPGREDRPAATISTNAPLSDADKAAQPPVAETQPPAVATRWLERSNALAAANPTSLADPAANEPSAVVADASPAPQAQMQKPPQAQPPLPAAGQFTAADPLLETPTHSVQMLLAAILGALALAGVMGRVIFNFVGTRRRAKRKLRGRRAAIWKSATPGRRGSTVYQGVDALPPQPHFPRDLDQASEPDDKIVQLLRDFSRKNRRRPNGRGPNERQRGVGSLL